MFFTRKKEKNSTIKEVHIQMEKELFQKLKAKVYGQGKSLREWINEKAREEVAS